MSTSCGSIPKGWNIWSSCAVSVSLANIADFSGLATLTILFGVDVD